VLPIYRYIFMNTSQFHKVDNQIFVCVMNWKKKIIVKVSLYASIVLLCCV